MESFRSIRKRKAKEVIVDKNSFFYDEDKAFLASFVIHIIILLLMFVICDTPYTKPPISISISFDQNSVEDIDFEKSLAIESLDKLANENIQHVADEVVLDSSDTDISNQISSDVLKEEKSVSIPDNVAILDVPAKEMTSVYTSASANTTPDTAQVIKKDRDSLPSHTENIIESLIQSTNNAIASNRRQAAAASGAGNRDVGSIEGRLDNAGAKTGDVQISISWNTKDDIDLHVMYTPGNGLVDEINWTNRTGRISNGMLDVDMNAIPGMLSTTPVENVFWPAGSSPRGHFRVGVHFFRSWSGSSAVPVLVRIKNGQEIYTINTVAKLLSAPQPIRDFVYPNNSKKNKF